MASTLSAMEAAAANELAARKRMALRVFRPMKHQEPIFEMPRVKYMVISGGNRGGKTVSLTALITSIILDEPITLEDGTQVYTRMPWQKGRCLTVWFACIDSRHIGNVLHKNFFRSGAFKVVYDKNTKALRAFDPDLDPKRGIKPQDSPPFIPARYIADEGFSWDRKSDNIFTKVGIKNPMTGEMLAEIHAYTSKSDPPQGVPVDIVLCDESLQRSGFIDELKARLLDRDGQLVWSAWNSDLGDDDLSKFNAMVDREIEAESGVAKRVVLTMSGNKHLSRKSVREFLAGCSSQEERDQRDLGINPSAKLLMYPLFDKNFHCAFSDDETADDLLAKTIRQRKGVPPADWTRSLILDPGTNKPGVLLCAVPPPEFGDFVVPYKEFYPGRLDAIQLAELLRRDTHGTRFYRFLMDRRAGRQTAMGASHTIAAGYEAAFEKSNLRCTLSKFKFALASDNVGARQMTLQSWMHPHRASGLPKLRIVVDGCPELCDQLRKVKKDVIRKEVVDERKAPGGGHDLVDCLEYFAASSPRYVRQQPTVEDGSPGYQRYMAKFGKTKDSREPVVFGNRY